MYLNVMVKVLSIQELFESRTSNTYWKFLIVLSTLSTNCANKTLAHNSSRGIVVDLTGATRDFAVNKAVEL